MTSFLNGLPKVDGYVFAHHADELFSPVLNQVALTHTLAVPGGGCDWYQRTKGNCCDFCAFPGLTDGITGGTLLAASQFKRMLDQAHNSCPNPAILNVFNGGNFFVENEIPPAFRRQVYRYAAENPHIKILMVESKPEYITQECLQEATDILGETKLMVGIGLESADNRIRNKVLRKGISQDSFEQSVTLMHKNGVLVFSYVFLKAMGLSEGEAVADVITTCQYLFRLGVDHMALSCAFVQEDTPYETAYRKYLETGVEGADSFRPPWIWSIFEIAELAHQYKWPLTIGGLDDTPPPLAVASNCEECTPRCLEILNAYRTSGSYDIIRGSDCTVCLPTYRRDRA